MSYPNQQFPQGFPGQQQGYQQPPQQYGPPPQQQYQQYPQQMPQGYQQGPPQQEAPPLVQGSIDDFFGQPSSASGPALKFDNPGDAYAGIVARPMGPGDVVQQTIPGQNTPATYRDGRPKFVLRVPLQVQADDRYTDGQATWYVQGGARDELVRAMAEAGAPSGAPEAGAGLVITFTGTRPSGPGLNPRKIYNVRYIRPEGAASAPQQQAPVQQEQAPVQQQPAPQQQAPVQQQSAPAPQQPQAGPSAGDMPEDKSELLARLKAAQSG